MQTVRYEIDPFNRLIFSDASVSGSGLPEFRRVLEGRFQVDARNNLSYLVKGPALSDESMPNQIKLDGSWSLTKNHELRIALDKLGRETLGDQVTLRGSVLDVDGNNLAFCVTTTTGENKQSTYVLNLSGAWKVDEDNRISFYVEKEDGRYDILVFNAAWEMGDDHKIIYRYEKASLITKKRETHTLTFKGYWDIKEKYRVSYVIDKSAGSVFDFRTSAGILSANYIKFQVGIGLEGDSEMNRTNRVIALFGEWKFARGSGLVFEIRYGLFMKRSIIFGADIVLTKNDTFTFKLRSADGNKDLDLEMELDHQIPGGGRLFLRALKEKGELAVCAGAAFGW